MSQRRIDFQGFHWLDISNPDPDSLQAIAEKYELHPTSVQDCLQPEHLPKYEFINDLHFVVLRVYDPDCSADADTVQELTRKVAIFYSDRFVISIHRREQPFVQALVEKWGAKNKDPHLTPEHILSSIVNESVRSYEKPVLECMNNLELIEQEIFGAGTQRKFRMQKGYYLKRRISVFKRLLRATLEPLNHMMADAEKIVMPHFQNAREQIDSLYFYSDETTESISSLMNLHISLASQRTNEASRKTNEVMRVLTIFSCFFLPINFIASIYGMNFEFMPELRSPLGYPFALGLMAAVVLVIFIWFRRKGWLKRTSER